MYSTCTFSDIQSHIDGRLSAPALEPVSVDEMDLHAKVGGPEESGLVLSYIRAARQWVENQVDISLGERTVTLYMDEFPIETIEVRFPPVNSVTHVKYLDANGTLTTLSSSEYRTDLVGRPARITPIYGGVWPITYEGTNVVQIEMVVGFTSPSDVPDSAKQAIRYMAGLMFAKREPTDEDLSLVRRILDPIRWKGDV